MSKVHDYWCCKADFGKHEVNCNNYAPSEHEYPPVWDEVLKSWVNVPPYARGGQGAKE